MIKSLSKDNLDLKFEGTTGERGSKHKVRENPGKFKDETNNPETTLSTVIFFLANQVEASWTISDNSIAGKPPKLLTHKITESFPSPRWNEYVI